ISIPCLIPQGSKRQARYDIGVDRRAITPCRGGHPANQGSAQKPSGKAQKTAGMSGRTAIICSGSIVTLAATECLNRAASLTIITNCGECRVTASKRSPRTKAVRLIVAPTRWGAPALVRSLARGALTWRRPLRGEIDGIERLAPGHEQPVALGS